MKRRVVITGLGAVTPIGNTVEEFWNGVRKGACGIGTITKFDTAEYKVHLAGEVKGFVAKERMDFKAARRMGTFSQYAVAAAKEAFADARLGFDNNELGVSAAEGHAVNLRVFGDCELIALLEGHVFDSAHLLGETADGLNVVATCQIRDLTFF